MAKNPTAEAIQKAGKPSPSRNNLPAAAFQATVGSVNEAPTNTLPGAMAQHVAERRKSEDLAKSVPASHRVQRAFTAATFGGSSGSGPASTVDSLQTSLTSSTLNLIEEDKKRKEERRRAQMAKGI